MTLLTRDMASVAMAAVQPTFDYLSSRRWASSSHLHIVIAEWDPTTRDHTIISERSIGNVQLWEYDYKEIAHGKLRLTARTGLSSREVQLLHPELLEMGDVKYWGSVIEGNLIVACSGVQAQFDEAMAKCVMAVIKAMLQNRVNDLIEANVDGDWFEHSN